MKAVEFKSRIENKSIRIPETIKSEGFAHKNVKVIILFDEADEEDEFKKVSAVKFLEGYEDSDSIYDEA